MNPPSTSSHRSPQLTLWAAALFLGLPLSAVANVTLPAIFSDHAVLQKSAKTPVWGKAAAHEKVTVTLDKSTATTTAGADGKWKLELDLSKEGQGPWEMTAEGANKLTIHDVLVGEVWVCSGQSNMWFTLNEAIGGDEEVKQCTDPLIRQFWANRMASPTPQDDAPGGWMLASPGANSNFTAVGYFFGKRLRTQLKVPVGLLKTCLGGTPSEAWTSAQALDTVPDLKEGKDKAIALCQNYLDYQAKHKAWVEKYQRQDHPLPQNLDSYIKPDAPTTDWKPIFLPNKFSDIGLPDAGAVWLRKEITLPDSAVNRQSIVVLGDFSDAVTLYWNGTKIADQNIRGVGGNIYVTSEHVLTNKVTLAVRIANPSFGMGIISGKSAFAINGVTLQGEWLAKVEYELPPLNAEAKASLPVAPPIPTYDETNTATFLYNGMVHPFMPYRIAGVIWYQGEANAGRAFQYRTAFPLMIKDWRKNWGQGDFPFFYCQLASFNGISTVPGENDWAELREAQDMALKLPNTGEAILIDIGEEANIHPRNKKDAGDRLARIALAKTYNQQKVVYSGPTYQSLTVEGDKIRVHFKNTQSGLVAKPLPATYIPTTTQMDVTRPLVRHSPDSEVEGFAICGEDRKWVWANASIKGSDVIVSAAGLSKPVAVRYAWASNPICNLYNGADLPAGPFRSDSFPCTTEKAKY